jgi:N-acetylglucosaminyldiphosphoundecaprenol N-acetyl-beta-D-mannosaminyltransferase
VVDAGKRSVLGILVNVIDYEAAVERVLAAAHERHGLSVAALAVHGVMTGVLDPEHKFRLNHLDLAVPDGQPVRWALNLLHAAGLKDRVYGPELTVRLCEAAAREGLPIFLFGSRAEVLDSLEKELSRRLPRLRIAGRRPSVFRRLSSSEQDALIEEVRGSGASIVFVGIGCPRQEVWAFENTDSLGLPVVAVGAAFDFHARHIPQAPPWMQRLGLEWLFRLTHEPRRLWRRYLLSNPLFLILLAGHWLRVWRPAREGRHPRPERLRYG